MFKTSAQRDVDKSSGTFIIVTSEYFVHSFAHPSHQFYVPQNQKMSTDEATAAKEQNRVKAKATGDLDKVTDYVEERELDSARVADSMRAMLGKSSAAKKAGMENDLMNVKIQEADVQLIVDELDLEPKEAERALRKARGDVVRALCELVR